MTPRMAVCVLVAVLTVPLLTVAHAQAPAQQGITPERVRESIDRAVKYFVNNQNRWSKADWEYHRGALSSLCTLALLNAGVKPNEEPVKSALGYLRDVRPDSTYAISLQTMVLAETRSAQDLARIAENVQRLQDIQIAEGPAKGAWNYGSRGGDGDNSNSQFALLALYEAERAGVQVNSQTWRWAKRYWEDCQNVDGSWGYKKGYPGTGSMTCAGIASLVIASGKAGSPDARVDFNTGRIDCCMRADSSQDRIDRGLQWLGNQFSVDRNPGSRSWLLYYLYGVERVGRMTAQRFIGRHDWYREGTDKLVRDQDTISGKWTGTLLTEENPEVATALALLFLSKGRRPILMAKVQYGQGDDWNQHRSDVGKLTRYVEPKWNLDLTWQITRLEAASVEDLLQSPVLYLCGSRSPLPATAQAQQQLAEKLRDYIDRGGFLFAEPTCSGSDFDRGFRLLMEKVFPEPEYQLRVLPPEHPIWRAEEPVETKYQRTMLGIEFGCRTSVVYCPPFPASDPGPSLSCLWELSFVGREVKYPKVAQDQIDAALSIGINVLAYATNRELKRKEETLRPRMAAGPNDAVGRGKIYVASLRHPGGCSAAPRALPNLLEVARRELNIRTNIENRELSIDDDALFDYHLVFMHGRNNFRLTDREREQLRKYVERGGIILADSICASQAFTDAFHREMAIIFPKNKLEQIPAGDPIFTNRYGGFELKTVSRRDPQSATGSTPMRVATRQVPPLLEAIRVDEHWGVIFSPYDLSCALEKRDSIECKGYTREDAARIGINVLLYSTNE